MRLGGLGQLWQTLVKLLSVMFLCQLLSPVVAFIAILLVGPDTVVSSEVSEVITNSTEKAGLTVETNSSSDDTCCVGESACPRDHRPDPAQCQNSSQPCSELPLACLACTCDYNCHYGQLSTASCSVVEGVLCSGERAARLDRPFLCSYCFLTPDHLHQCTNRALGCRSSGSPSSSNHWYVANCTVTPDTLCLGKHVFSKRRECSWTQGYSWNTAMGLSITLGGFGADRFYLGHWQEGIGKLFSFGGLGVWTLVDVVLVATRYIGPADGSLYI